MHQGIPKTLHLIAIIVFLTFVFGVIEQIRSTKIHSSSTKINSLLDQTTTEALTKNDFTICNKLPYTFKYKDSLHSFKEQNLYSLYPREKCLKDYYKKTYDPQTCEALAKVDESEGIECKMFLAEVYSDTHLCENLGGSYKGGAAECKALVTLDHKYCYDIPKDEHDTSLYSRAVSLCIGDVVFRTKDKTPCLEIDGPNYGNQWDLNRNSCIWNAMYSLQGKTVHWYCDDMVEETRDARIFSDKQDCLDGEPRGNYISIPPRIRN